MKRSPRRPLILKRRKLPFQQNDLPAAESLAKAPEEPLQSAASQRIPDGIHIVDHPSAPDVQVVVVPQTANLQSVIGALSAKGKECGAQGPNKFILLSASGKLGSISTKSTGGQLVKEETKNTHPDRNPLSVTKTIHKELDCSPLDESLTNITWLGKTTSSAIGQQPAKTTAMTEKENQDPRQQAPQAQKAAQTEAASERPPYSYMAMIQFAINSSSSGKMTLKEIYTWMEDHFPYFREVAKPGWKNSIRHNLSLHDMFTRETSPDDKVSYWTIRPEANRCLTLDQVYKPGCDPTSGPVSVPMLLYNHQNHRRTASDAQNQQTSFEKKMKPLLPRAESYLVPVQLPISSSVYLTSSSSAQIPHADSQKKKITKRVRIAPKVETKVIRNKDHNEQDPPPVKDKEKDVDVQVPVSCKTLHAPPRRESSSSRRKQSLVHSAHDEPVILYPENGSFDSGISCSCPTFQESPKAELTEQLEAQRPPQEHCFKTPIKSSSLLASSTPSKPHTLVLPEPWRVTPLGKGMQNVLDFSPIRTPNGPMVTPQRQYLTPVSYCSTPFDEYKIFSSPTEPQTCQRPKATEPPTEAESPDAKRRRGSCSRELLQAGGATPGNCSITEGLVLDTLNDSLSKILVDISFSGGDEEELGLANISWSDLIPQLK
ncbi:forkhead box protein M1 [Genypterus blacodes]|uniref:forkhead box protein M1 n=1 Tax=Genypterus blacodes TaxID=154954 RepID=UPI003F758BB7